ncbi:MAG: Spy/CpxP family protein refolding chaperone [Thermoanaerobaculia bacterium]
MLKTTRIFALLAALGALAVSAASAAPAAPGAPTDSPAPKTQPAPAAPSAAAQPGTAPEAGAAASAAPAPAGPATAASPATASEDPADNPVLGTKMVAAWKEDLHLRPEQQASLDKLHLDFVAKFSPLLQQLRAKGLEIRNARHAPVVDQELLKKLRTEMGEVGGQMRDLGSKFEQEFANLLDDEQKRSFEKNITGFRLGLQHQMLPKLQPVTPTPAQPSTQKVASR